MTSLSPRAAGAHRRRRYVPVTLREQTERPVTITEGTNWLPRWPLPVPGVLRSFEEAVAQGSRETPAPEGWDGQASVRIVEALRDAPTQLT